MGNSAVLARFVAFHRELRLSPLIATKYIEECVYITVYEHNEGDLFCTSHKALALKMCKHDDNTFLYFKTYIAVDERKLPYTNVH